MIRLGILFVLLLSFFFLLQGSLQTWQESDPVQESAPKPRKPKTVALPKQVRFYVDVPAVLPDLASGYVFNEKRSLLEETPQDEFPAEEPEAKNEEPVIDIEELTFVGSIITDKIRQAMVIYLPAPEPDMVARVGGGMPGGAAPWQQQQGRFPGNRPQGMPTPPATIQPAPPGEPKSAMIHEGEEFHGYMVASVLPDKLVLKRGEEEYVRTLFDPEKKRLSPPALPERRPQIVPSQPGQQAMRGAAPGAMQQPQFPGQMSRRQPPMSPSAQQGIQPPQPPQPSMPAAGQPGAIPMRRHGVQPEVIQRRRIPASTGNP